MTRCKSCNEELTAVELTHDSHGHLGLCCDCFDIDVFGVDALPTINRERAAKGRTPLVYVPPNQR